LRFNDLIATVLAARADGSVTRGILWRQCVDLLAQFDRGGSTPDEDTQLDRIVHSLAVLRPEIAMSQRLASIVELGPRLRSLRLIHFLLDDEVPVVVAAMKRAHLEDQQWPGLIAQAGPLARSVLRQREDLGALARRALDAFGPTDLSLADYSPRQASVVEMRAGPALAPRQQEDDGDQIRKIVDRIERFTSERQARIDGAKGSQPGRQAPEPAGNIDQFSFATDAQGVLTSVAGAPSAAAVGLQIGTPSLDRSYGADGQILGAFKRRGAFRDGRFAIGEGLLRGSWLVCADPQFDQGSGRFTGYVGSARKSGSLEQAPRIEEVSGTPWEDRGADQNESASMRQLIHELRTPLNGVMGFAEIIESQLLGPVNDSYRSMAGEIVTDVRRLVEILDDLDYASRDDGHRPARLPGETDLAALLNDAIARFALDRQGRPKMRLSSESHPPALDVAQAVAERMIMHLVRALTACAGDETLLAECHDHHDTVELTIARPGSMIGLTDAQLFDSGFEHMATIPDAPVLGVGFGLRLVRRLAYANKGAFMASPDHFSLVLPSGRHDVGEQHQLS
jgi:signal transduction histidine kinase